MNNSILDKAKEAELLLASAEACRAELAGAKRLREKLENNEMTISVIGQFKRGKSTLVNAILGEKLLPVGIVPVTSVVTRIEYGPKYAAVHFENGSIKTIDERELSEYINEQENPDNKRGVSSVTLRTEAEFLKSGITFVDTPGVGSAHKHNSDAAYAFAKESDAVIFMLSVDSPINEIEINFLKNAKEFAAKFYFVINKTDNIDKEELQEYLTYCRKLLCSLMEAESIMMFPVSAKKGTGLAELTDKIQRDCKTSTEEILRQSTAMKLKDILTAAMVKLELYWNALRLPVGKQESRFNEMKKVLAEIEEKSREIAGGLEGETDQSKYCEISTMLELELNGIRQSLSGAVTELFGMEYYYELTELNLIEAYQFDSSRDSIAVLRNKFMKETGKLCKELSETLNLILLYQEKNTITVVRKVDDLNKLNKKLRKLRSEL